MVRRRLGPVHRMERIHDPLTFIPNQHQFSTASRRSYFFWYRRSGSVVLYLSLSTVLLHVCKASHAFLHTSPKTQQTSTYRQITSFSFPHLHASYVLDLRSALYCMAWHRIHPHTLLDFTWCFRLLSRRGVHRQRFNNITTAYSLCFV
jgi:hypothetical protein